MPTPVPKTLVQYLEDRVRVLEQEAHRKVDMNEMDQRQLWDELERSSINHGALKELNELIRALTAGEVTADVFRPDAKFFSIFTDGGSNATP